MNKHMKNVVVAALVILVSLATLTTFAGCTTSGRTSERDTPESTYADAIISAQLYFDRGDEYVIVDITNNSNQIIEIVWPKASWRGNYLIEYTNHRDANAQPIPASTLLPDARARRLLVSKNSAIFIGGKFYKLTKWVENARPGEFVFAYAIDGNEQMFVL